MNKKKMSIFEDLITRGGVIQNKNHLRLFKNIPFSMYPARAFAITINDIYKKKGIEYIKELGKIMGESSARAFNKELKKMGSLIKRDYQTIPNLIEVSGFGQLSAFEEKKNLIIIKVKDHPVIVPGSKLFKKESCICDFYGEVYSAYIRIFKGVKKVKIKHTKCICKKEDMCEWEFKW